MKKESKTVDQIIKSHELSNPVILRAAKIYKEQREAEQAAVLVDLFHTLDDVEGRLVYILKDARKAEKAAKDRLVAFNKLKEKFTQDGDLESFRKEASKLNISL